MCDSPPPPVSLLAQAHLQVVLVVLLDFGQLAFELLVLTLLHGDRSGYRRADIVTFAWTRTLSAKATSMLRSRNSLISASSRSLAAITARNPSGATVPVTDDENGPADPENESILRSSAPIRLTGTLMQVRDVNAAVVTPTARDPRYLLRFAGRSLPTLRIRSLCRFVDVLLVGGGFKVDRRVDREIAIFGLGAAPLAPLPRRAL